MLTGSGVDEAWTTGVQLGEAVLELLRAGLPFTNENLSDTYEKKRRASWVEQRSPRGRERPQRLPSRHRPRHHRHGPRRTHPRKALTSARTFRPRTQQIRPFSSRPADALKLQRRRRTGSRLDGRPLHDALLTARGWPEIPFDGRLLVTHQDALLLGGKVQAMPGFADHVVFRDLGLCIDCEEKTCIAMCSGQAITLGDDGLPAFEREKCIHCGACLWNCAQSPDGEHANIDFRPAPEACTPRRTELSGQPHEFILL